MRQQMAMCPQKCYAVVLALKVEGAHAPRNVALKAGKLRRPILLEGFQPAYTLFLTQ